MKETHRSKPRKEGANVEEEGPRKGFSRRG
jgi:hypothetical protein